MYPYLDIFFFVFHTVLICFNLFGWIWKKTRKANLVLLLTTTFSWFVLGIWYGWGYCPCTEWHHQVRVKLGDYDMPNSYIKFCIDLLTGWDVNAWLVDAFTLFFFLAALTASIIVNFKDYKLGTTNKGL